MIEGGTFSKNKKMLDNVIVSKPYQVSRFYSQAIRNSFFPGLFLSVNMQLC